MKVNLTLACFSYVTNKFKLGWVEFCWWSSSSSPDTPASRHSYFGSHVFLGLNREISFARNTQNLVPASLSHCLLPLYTVPLGSYHTELPSLRICYLGQIEWSGEQIQQVMPIVKHIYWNGPCNRAKWSYDDKLKDRDADNHAAIRSVKLVRKAWNSIENFCYAVHIGRPKKSGVLG